MHPQQPATAAALTGSPSHTPLSFVSDLVLGGTSGVLAKTLTAPLERVKILLQLQSASSSSSPTAVVALHSKPYSGMLDALVRVPREQGFLSFWRGNLANCLRYFPTQGVNFATKELWSSIFVQPSAEVGAALHYAGVLASGGAAGATSLTLAYPLEFAFTRLAADRGTGSARRFRGIGDVLAQTLRADGLRGVYRGYLPSVAGIVAYRAVYFGGYDIATREALPALGYAAHQQHSPWLVLVKLALALGIDISASLFAYPLDTIRRALMMQSGRPAGDAAPFRTAFGAARWILTRDGAAGFYRGALTNSVRAVGSALVLVLFDEMRHAARFAQGGARQQ